MKINVIDIEATCWDTKTDNVPEIIQIGISQVNLASKTITPPYSVMVKPVMSAELSPFCIELTGLTNERVFGEGVLFSEAVKHLQEKFKLNKMPWASWGEYDRTMFVKDSERHGIPYPLFNQHLNLRVMYGVLSGNQKLGLDKAMKALGLELEGRHHDGADDAYNIAKILVHFSNRFAD